MAAAAWEVRLTVTVWIHGTETVLVLRLGFLEVLLGLLHDPVLHLLGADTPVFVGIDSEEEKKNTVTIKKNSSYGRNVQIQPKNKVKTELLGDSVSSLRAKTDYLVSFVHGLHH